MFTTGSVNFGAEGEVRSTLTFPVHDRTILRMDSRSKSIAPPLKKEIPLPALPARIKQETVVESYGSADVTTRYVPELVPYPYQRTLTIELPVPEWVRSLDVAAVVIQATVSVPDEEKAELKTEPFSDWTLTLDSRTLFQKVVPTLYALIPGTGNRYTAWTMALAGWLAADHRTRPFTISLTLGFRTVSLVDANMTLYPEVEYDISDWMLRPIKALADECPLEESDEEFELVSSYPASLSGEPGFQE